MIRPLRLALAACLPATFVAPTAAQEPQSSAAAKELAQLLAERKLDSFAARVPNTPDEFAATLVFPGQMIVVWAKFSAPAVLNEKLINRAYREAYIDLNSASDPASRNFVTDLGADGIRRGGKNQPSDSHDVGTKSMRFDGSWREDKMSEQVQICLCLGTPIVPIHDEMGVSCSRNFNGIPRRQYSSRKRPQMPHSLVWR